MSEILSERPKAILFDGDGTIQGPEFDALPSDETAYWIRRARDELDIGFGIVTARPHRMTKGTIAKLGLNIPSAFDGGARIATPKMNFKLDEFSMDRSLQLDVLEIAEAQAIPLYNSAQQFDGHPITKSGQVGKRNTKLYAGPLEINRAAEFAASLTAVEGIAAYVSTSWTPGKDNRDIHITAKEATKRRALDYILGTFLKVDPKDVWYFGDGPNDIPAMQTGVRSFAMGNSAPEVFEVAEFRAGSWYENGVAEVIKREIFGITEPSAVPSVDKISSPIYQTTAV